MAWCGGTSTVQWRGWHWGAYGPSSTQCLATQRLDSPGVILGISHKSKKGLIWEEEAVCNRSCRTQPNNNTGFLSEFLYCQNLEVCSSFGNTKCRLLPYT